MGYILITRLGVYYNKWTSSCILLKYLGVYFNNWIFVVVEVSLVHILMKGHGACLIKGRGAYLIKGCGAYYFNLSFTCLKGSQYIRLNFVLYTREAKPKFGR